MKLAVALICVLLCVITTSKAQTTGCNLCQFIVNYADQYIESNRTMTKINEALNKVCDIFPAGFQELCLDFIETESAALMQLLLDAYPPQFICTKLGFCNTEETLRSSEKRQAREGLENIICNSCMLGERLMQSVKESNLNKEEAQKVLTQALDAACSGISPNSADNMALQEFCHQIVGDFVPKLADWVYLGKEGHSPQTSYCGVVGFCEEF